MLPISYSPISTLKFPTNSSLWGTPFLFSNNTLVTYPITSSFIERKMPYFLKSRLRLKVSVLPPVRLSPGYVRGKQTSLNFLVSLSGRLTKLILHGPSQNSLCSNSWSGPWHFVRYARVRETRKIPDNVFLLRAHILWIVRTLGRQHTIKIAKGLFLEIRVFFYSKLLWCGWCNKVFLEKL